MIMVISEENKDIKNTNTFVETIISCIYGINESNRKYNSLESGHVVEMFSRTRFVCDSNINPVYDMT